MGRVYLVELPPIGKIFALKRLEPDPLLETLLGPKTIEELFRSEAMTLAKIQHPNVVDVLDFDQDRQGLFYVMAYHGDSLGQLIGESYRPDIPSRMLPITKAVEYSRQLLNGLACLHYFDIIHRDVKPFNLLITEDDTLKLCDFGLSKLRGEKFKGPSNLNVGSPFYASPEQEKDPDKVDFSSDLFSVGVILYRTLTGKLPFLDNHYTPPSVLNPDVNQDWDRLIARALSKNPSKRFQRAEEMRDRLDHIFESWKVRQEKICTFDTHEEKESLPKTKEFHLRQNRIKVGPKAAQELFNLDVLWRPNKYLINQFLVIDEHQIEDQTTGLIWQRSGSPYPLNRQQAHNYVDHLNQNRLGGKRNWQLPTIPQLSTLLTALPHGKGLCIKPIFDRRQRSLWSCDLRSYTAAWIIHLDMGFISFADINNRYYVRAVSPNNS